MPRKTIHQFTRVLAVAVLAADWILGPWLVVQRGLPSDVGNEPDTPVQRFRQAAIGGGSVTPMRIVWTVHCPRPGTPAKDLTVAQDEEH